MSKPLSDTISGVVIGVLTGALIFAGITIFWLCQIIAQQQALIHACRGGIQQ